MRIFLTRRAERNYDSIKGYIKQEWGDKTAGEFVQKTDELFSLLKMYPLMRQIEKGRHQRVSTLSTYADTIKIKPEKTVVLAFFDVRQNPKKKFP